MASILTKFERPQPDCHPSTVPSAAFSTLLSRTQRMDAVLPTPAVSRDSKVGDELAVFGQVKVSFLLLVIRVISCTNGPAMRLLLRLAAMYPLWWRLATAISFSRKAPCTTEPCLEVADHINSLLNKSTHLSSGELGW